MPYSSIEAKPIGDLCQIIDCEHKTAPYVEKSEFLVVRTSNVRDGQLVMDDMKYTTEAGYAGWTQRAVPQHGDVFFTREAPAGETCLVPTSKKVCMGQRMVLLRPNREVSDPFFLSQILATEECKFAIKRLSIGSTVSRINISDIKSLKVAAPPLPEQKKIAQILSTWDQAITATERLLENSRQRKKALMQQLLTGKKRLPGFEGEWGKYVLSEVTKIIVSPVDKKSDPDERPVLLCNYTDVYYNTRIVRNMPFMEATAKVSEIEKYTLEAGDVVITKDSETPGDIAVPALISEDLGGVVCGYHLAILRARPSKLNGAFLNCLLSMPSTRYYFFTLATGATRFGLSVSAIHNAEVTLPAVPEQEAIAKILTVCDDEVEVIARRLRSLKQEKQALMQQLLTGKRRVKVDTEVA